MSLEKRIHSELPGSLTSGQLFYEILCVNFTKATVKHIQQIGMAEVF